MKTIQLSQPYLPDSAIDGVVEVLKSGWVAQGKKVAEFEEAAAKLLGVKYVVALSSATAGLHASLLSLGIGSGDEVIVPSFTWVSTANVVEMCGAKVVFADIDLETYNASLNDICGKLTDKTRAVIPVHLFGKPFDVQELQERLPKSVAILEDAACDLGSQLNNVFSGIQGDLGVFSFHPRKSITTGEGGMAVTEDVSLYQKILRLRNHGQNSSLKDSIEGVLSLTDCPEVGYNYRMTDIQAALGLPQLALLTRFIDERRKKTLLYSELLSDIEELVLPSEGVGEVHSWQSYVVRVSKNERNRIMKNLMEQGVEARPGTHAVHTLKFYKMKYSLKENYCPNALEARDSTIALPLHNHLSEKDVRFISAQLLQAIDDKR